MRCKLYLSLAVVGTLFGSPVWAATNNNDAHDQPVHKVFFAGGQSNARPDWAAGIREVLTATYGEDMTLVHRFHGGRWLQGWYKDGTTQADYTTDIYNAETNTASLQKAIVALDEAGTKWEFSGFFWFQGEGDSGSDEAMDLYEQRFNGILNQMRVDFEITNEFALVVAVIDGNQNKKYDTPAHLAGRTRAAVEKMRGILIKIGSGERAAYVDTREYPRADAWHMHGGHRKLVGKAMAEKAVALSPVKK